MSSTSRHDTGNTNCDAYLIEILREEVASREAELDALRGSLHYRVGGWALGAFPPGRGTIVFFARLLRLFLQRRRKGASPTVTARGNNAAMLDASTIVFGRSVPSNFGSDSVLHTDDPTLIAERLDKQDGKPGVLVIRTLSEAVLRRVARARRHGWRVVWHPEDDDSMLDPALAAYMRAQADEIHPMGEGA